MQRIFILLLFVWSAHTQAQIRTRFFMDGEPFRQDVFEDSIALVSYLKSIQWKWVNQGYFFSGIDSVIQSGDSRAIYMHKGKKIKANLTGFRGKNPANQLKKRLAYLENNGYPFAMVFLDSLVLNKEGLTGRLKEIVGPEIRYDSASFVHPVGTDHGYIYRLLDIVPGELYSQRNYSLLIRKIERSPILALNGPPDLSFTGDRARIYLDITEEPANSFQGVLGLQQNGDRSSSLVGNIELDIQNLFQSGKQLRFSWERFSEQSQLLNIHYKHPFILESPLSPTFKFELLKQDTTFLTRMLGLGVHAFLAPRVELSLEYEQTNGSLLSTDISTLASSGLSGYKRTLYQAGLSQGHTSSLRSLTNGFVWSFSSAMGRKEIRRDPNIPESYYDSLKVNSNYFRIHGSAALQHRVFRRQAIFHHISVGTLQNQALVQNELFRLGGLQSLRGFNEKQLFAQSYLLSRAEFRSFFESKSYVYLFYDQLIYQRNNLTDYPVGLGMGFALATSSGQFSFALAIGKSRDQQISFETVKVHFGYVSKF